MSSSKRSVLSPKDSPSKEDSSWGSWSNSKFRRNFFRTWKPDKDLAFADKDKEDSLLELSLTVHSYKSNTAYSDEEDSEIIDTDTFSLKESEELARHPEEEAEESTLPLQMQCTDSLEALYVRILSHPFPFLVAMVDDEINTLLDIPSSETDSLLKGVVHTYYAQSELKGLIRMFVREALNGLTNKQEIFRQNTPEVKVLVRLMRCLGKSLLFDCLLPVLEMLEKTPHVTGRVSGGEMYMIDVLLEGLSKSKVPPLLKVVLTEVYHTSEAMIEDGGGISVCSLVFLRFLSPALVNPSKHGLPELTGADHQEIKEKKLTLMKVAKTVQQLANVSVNPQNSVPAEFKEYFSFKVPVVQGFIHTFGSALANPSVMKRKSLASITKQHKRDALVYFVWEWLEKLATSSQAMLRVSMKKGLLRKEGGSIFKNRRRYLVLSPLHGKLFYYKEEKRVKSKSPSIGIKPLWTGCIDISRCLFRRVSAADRIAWKLEENREYFEIVNELESSSVVSWTRVGKRMKRKRHRRFVFSSVNSELVEEWINELRYCKERFKAIHLE